MPSPDLTTNNSEAPLPSPISPNIDHSTVDSTNLTNNMITNAYIFPALMTLPQQRTTPLPSTTTSLPAGCATPYPCSRATPPPASTNAEQNDVGLFVPSATTAVQSDPPQNAMPVPSAITTSNQLPPVTSVVGLDKDLAGHGRGHRVMDCSPSSVAGHQQPEWPKMSVSLYVTPNVITVAVQPALV